jgi:RNA polymerase sigma-70 factor (ECF subfamily)
LRICLILTEFEITNQPKTNALIALMCFHTSRFNARQSNENSLILFEQQDEDLWDQELINRGWHYLNISAQGNELSAYHLEARIASLHSNKEDTKEKWEEILQLYNQLLLINYSPAVALNRTYALYKANGRQAALAEAEKLKLEGSHFYFLLLGELYKCIDNNKAKQNFQKAFSLAKTQTEKQCIREKIDSL